MDCIGGSLDLWLPVGFSQGGSQQETVQQESEQQHCDLAASLLEGHAPVRQPSVHSTLSKSPW